VFWTVVQPPLALSVPLRSTFQSSAPALLHRTTCSSATRDRKGKRSNCSCCSYRFLYEFPCSLPHQPHTLLWPRSFELVFSPPRLLPFIRIPMTPPKPSSPRIKSDPVNFLRLHYIFFLFPLCIPRSSSRNAFFVSLRNLERLPPRTRPSFPIFYSLIPLLVGQLVASFPSADMHFG